MIKLSTILIVYISLSKTYKSEAFQPLASPSLSFISYLKEISKSRLLQSRNDSSPSKTETTDTKNSKEGLRLQALENQARDFRRFNEDCITTVHDAQVVGPQHVLVYDTTLRGMIFLYFICIFVKQNYVNNIRI